MQSKPNNHFVSKTVELSKEEDGSRVEGSNLNEERGYEGINTGDKITLAAPSAIDDDQTENNTDPGASLKIGKQYSGQHDPFVHSHF